jgi:pSer/pThr/pTyr-binding forkhead associated (FHA) protein
MASGIFKRSNRANVRPIEIGRRLVAEMDDKRSVDGDGRRIAPNHFVVALNPADHQELSSYLAALETELVEAAKEYARDEGYVLRGPVTVKLADDDSVKTGRIQITSKVRTNESPVVAASLVITGRDPLPLADKAITIGRSPDCDISFDDANISRRHAEIKVVLGAHVISDLGSTNGTKVNGVPITLERTLRDGDIIALGSNTIRFEAR